jgi:indolepyruvate ferredoxin oxidoreductase beta subunit
MKKDIVLAGVGGQGILSIATVIGYVAVQEGLFLKQAEVHGMSQRGGAVQSHLRISDKEIASDLIPMGKADMILSVEPMESLRYLPWLSPEGWLVTSTTPFINIPEYPEMDEIMAEIEKQKQFIKLDADNIAKEKGSVRSANMVMLGASSPILEIAPEKFEDALKFIFGSKGDDIVNMNIDAFHAGRDITLKKY